MRVLLLLFILLFNTPCLKAQNKELSQARSCIKSGKDLDKAKQTLWKLLHTGELSEKDSVKVCYTLYQVLKKQYEMGNESLYLKQKYDTASIFSVVKEMFEVACMLDTVDAKPDKNGTVKAKYRRKHANELAQYKSNLYYGGAYFIKNKDYQRAYSFFDLYLRFNKLPLFADAGYAEKDRMTIKAAYWATYCAYKQNDMEQVPLRATLALEEKEKRVYTLQYLAEAYQALGDSDNYLKFLNMGFEEYHHSPYFYPRLIDYYISRNQMNGALQVADRALAMDSTSVLYLYAKSTLLLNMGNYKECIDYSEKIINISDTIAEPYYNIGISWMNIAAQYELKLKGKQKQQRLTEIYTKACPYFETYRMLASHQKQKWGPALYTIYFHLNRGKQFEEIDNILKK